MDTYKKIGTVDLGDKTLTGETFIKHKTAFYDFETDTLKIETYFSKDGTFEIIDSRTVSVPDKLTAAFKEFLLTAATKIPAVSGAVKVVEGGR